MTPRPIELDKDIVRTAKVLVLTDYCYTNDNCDTQCRLLRLCEKNIAKGDMGVFKAWNETSLDKGLEIIGGSVRISYRSTTDTITKDGQTRTKVRSCPSKR